MAAEDPDRQQPSSSGSQPGEIDTVADRFEAAWRAGEEPAIDEFAEVAATDEPVSTQRELLAELVGIDLEWRWRDALKRSGASPAPVASNDSSSDAGESSAEISRRPLLEHYVSRYPVLAPLERLPEDLVAHEYYVRKRWGDGPGHGEYQKRFAAQWSALKETLDAVDEELGSDATGFSSNPTPSADETTLAYCVATADGKIRPLLDAVEEAQFQDVFAIGTSVQDRYTLEGELGCGGMGHVYLARDTRLSRLVAIKVVVDPTGEGKDVLEEALAEEARLGAVLDHPAIATVFDFGFHEGKPFAVFEYVDGDTLRDVLRRRRRIPLDEVRQIIGSLAEALDFAHGRGIVHRDLKPENIRASKQGPFKILDLGLAKEYRRSEDWATFAGTPAYASPEQAAGLPSDGRADQYALALITYEMLTGRRAYDDTNPLSLLRLHREATPTPPRVHMPELPERVNVAIVRALDKEPSRRFATCEDFALALGPMQSASRGQSLVRDRRGAETINVYVCHAGEDSELACDLAAALEREGFSTWYYERDALPGISYVAQCADAIRRCESFLLMLSPHSLTSRDVTTEVRQAYQGNRRFLPILVDLSQAEFQRRDPEWRSALGTAAMVELPSGDVPSTVSRLTRTLALWSIRPKRAVTEQPRVVRDRPDLDAVRRIWASDANQIDIRDLERVVFRNELIDDFLNRRGKCFLSANKGLGKTLLLTYKRYLLAEFYRAAKQGKEQHHVFFVPEGKPYLDFMSDVRSLSKTHEDYLSELVNAKRMWGLALRVSALSYHASLFTEDDADELALLPRRLRHWVRGARIEPTVVFKEVLGRSVKEINRVIDETENFLDHKLRLVHSGTVFFIDKVDQGIRHLSRSGWVSVQAGLIEAAWDAMNTNSHIKIHATIRQEAFSNYESDIKANLYGATTMIQYSENDLQRLLDQLTQCYEGKSFKEFVNLNVVKHPHRAFPEDSFQYVRRHTLGRPRDLVIISSELSTQQSSLSEPIYRRLVNDTSAAVLVSNVFDEMRAFLDCLHDKSERLRFLSLLPHNILTRDEAISICCQLNNISPDAYKFYASDSGQLHHPFCELYRAGLLGVIATDPDSQTSVQTFKQPHDLVNDFESSVPETPFYLIHPALDGCIRKYRATGVYNVFQHVVVGHGQPWEDRFGALSNVERILFSVSDRELRDMVHDVLKRLAVVAKEGRRERVRTEIETLREWGTLREKLIEGEYDDLYLWLEELIDGG